MQNLVVFGLWNVHKTLKLLTAIHGNFIEKLSGTSFLLSIMNFIASVT